MASYYYLIASLPELNSDGEMPLSYQDFLELCRKQVNSRTYQLLEELTLSSAEGPLVKEWAAVYGALTKEVNYQRSMKLGKAYPVPAEKDFATSQVAASALSAPNPLEAEKIMLAFEFEQLDSLTRTHFFDDYVLFAYAIKLKLLERQNSFQHDKGEKEFRRLINVVQKRVYRLEVS